MTFAAFWTTDVIPIASALTAVIAAFAAVAAAYLASQTVQETKGMREDAKEATALSAAQHKQQILELQTAGAAAYAGHEEQMAQQAAVFEHHLTVRRLVQMQRVAQALFDLVGAAREEVVHPSERFDFGNGRRLGATPIPALQTRLRIEVRVLKALGGPDISDVIPPTERDDDRAGLQRLWTTHGLTALQKLEGMIESEESLRPGV
jgi:hypothetical protein